ncbi:MAG: isocitrate/isopropylmalate dehydrogenase family protein [Candidatus Micrarchaeota archaeon]|nr:isocitrate/isopropylmalate dehydrogenase family protein [Candidatus Micrarchaeota archaeon]
MPRRRRSSALSTINRLHHRDKRSGKTRSYEITFIAGDGVGPEVSNAARWCVDAAAEKYGFEVSWDEQQAGEVALRRQGSVLPRRTIDSIARNRVALKGPITTPIGEGFRSVNVQMRKTLGLYANLRPARLFPGVKSRYSDVDLVVVRENTEDVYAGIEFDEGARATSQLIRLIASKSGERIAPDSAITIKPISISASRRIVEFAFRYAKDNRRKRVTAVHKANIMKSTDGLFLKVARQVASRHRGVIFDDMIVDSMCMQLVLKPEMYDVLVCPNLYGDIISDLCSGLVGGLGLAPSANIGDSCAVFEPVHGSAPKHAGKNEVNPTASMLSAAMMLGHIGEARAAKGLERSILKVIREGRVLTYDLKPRNPSTTTDMADAVIRKIRSGR